METEIHINARADIMAKRWGVARVTELAGLFTQWWALTLGGARREVDVNMSMNFDVNFAVSFQRMFRDFLEWFVFFGILRTSMNGY